MQPHPRSPLRLALLAALLALGGWAQTSKRPLTHQDYDSWRSIQNQQLSRDGRFLAYALFPQEGDGELVVRNLGTGKEWRAPIGQRPAPAPPDPANPEARPVPRGIRLAFTADLRAVVFSTFPSKADTDAARKANRKPEEMPRGGMAILDLASGQATRVADVKSFQVPEKGAGFIAFQREPKSPARPEEKKDATQQDQARRSRSSGAGSGASEEARPSELVLRRLADSTDRVFPDVLEYSFTKDAKSLVYAKADGVYVADPASAAGPRALAGGKGKYARLAWDEAQSELAFVSDRDGGKFHVYLWDRQSASARDAVSPAAAGFRQEFVISDKGALSFSKDGRHLFLGCAPPRPPVRKEAAAPSEDQVSLDLWHWKDDFIQPMQKVRATLERNRTYRAVYHLADGKFVQLGDASLADIVPSEDARWALGGDDRPYRRMVEYDTRYADAYLVDALTGERRPLAKKLHELPAWSPDARYALRFDGADWSTMAIPSGAMTNLTAKLGVKFRNEQNDTPGTPQAYGVAGWTKDGRWVLLYDRYDIWQVSPDGAAAKNLTAGLGRKEHLQFRYVKPDPDPRERAIDPAQPLLLRAENLDTYDTGFWRTRIDAAGPPQKLVMAAKDFSPPVKAKEAGVLLLTASTFREFPDLVVTDPEFREFRKVSDANPQQAQLLWGAAELVRYRNTDGVPLAGILIKPENFDPHRKYPMLIYIYERLSQGLHHFVEPRPSHSIVASYYASNGYLVLMPDIVYTTGYPGQSALKCVLPAIQAVADQGIVDENAIGIQGHSWGGYQIAYMVTQTTRFRAAAAGAPVADMISAYDGIRWGPGLPRQFQYERAQSRIGGSIWQYPTRFIENSPIFWADRVETPLLMLHNDADDAVPWYQGIEYYLALRRLGKEVYLCVYNGEPHGLRRRANQKDYTVRLQQFFDHYLKGAPEPEWMRRGVPYLERGR